MYTWLSLRVLHCCTYKLRLEPHVHSCYELHTTVGVILLSSTLNIQNHSNFQHVNKMAKQSLHENSLKFFKIQYRLTIFEGLQITKCARKLMILFILMSVEQKYSTPK